VTPGAATITSFTQTAAGAITVNWTNAPSTANPITSYTVVEATGSSTGGALTVCSQTAVGAASAANSCTYTPPAPYAGVLNVFSNTADGGTASDGGSTTTQLLKAPGTPTATVTDGGVSLAFTANVQDAGDTTTNPLIATGYKVALASTNAVLASTCTGTSPTITCVVNAATAGLSIGGSYSFKVASVNSAGTSAYSASASVDKTLLAKPSAPTGVTATVNYSAGTVLVSWTASANAASTGGVVTYSVTPYNGTTPTCATVTATSCSIAVADLSLTAAHPYNGIFTVTATVTGTAASGSAPTLTSSATSGATSVVPTLAAPSVALSFSSGLVATITGPGTSTPLGYNVQLQTCTSSVATTCTSTGSPTFVAYAGTSGNSYATVVPAYAITDGLYYNVIASAVSNAGAGTSSAQVSPAYTHAVQVPANVAGLAASVTNSSVTLSWSATAVSGTTVTYTVYSGVTSTPATAVTGCTAITVLTCTISGLTSDTIAAYYGVKASSTEATPQVSTGFASTVKPRLNGATQMAAPTLAYTAAGVTINFAVAQTDGQSTGVAQKVVVTAITVVNAVTGATLCTAAGTATSCTVSGAAAAAFITASGSDAKVKAYSTDASGISTGLSAASAALVLPTAVTASTIKVYGNANGLQVKWTATSNAVSYLILGTATTGSNLSASATAAANCVASVPTGSTSTTTTCSYIFPASALTTGAQYTFQIQSINGVGNSAYSSASTDSAGLAGVETGATGNATLTASASQPTVITTSANTAISNGINTQFATGVIGASYAAITSASAAPVPYNALSVEQFIQAVCAAITFAGTGAVNSACAADAAHGGGVAAVIAIETAAATAAGTFGNSVVANLSAESTALSAYMTAFGTCAALTSTVCNSAAANGSPGKLAYTAVGATLTALNAAIVTAETDFTANVALIVSAAQAKVGTPYAVAASGGQAVVVSWTGGSAVTGNAVTGYTGTLTQADGTTITCVTSGKGTLIGTSTYYNACPFIGVAANASYTFTVVANGELGDSTAATAATITSPGVPGAPASVTAASANAAGTTTTVTWTAPATGGTLVTGYTVTSTSSGTDTPTCTSGSAATLTCDLTTIAGETYTISVVANNSAVLGGSQSSVVATTTFVNYSVPATPAAPTVAVKASGTDFQATVTWTAPASSEALIDYTITATGGTISTCSVGSKTGNTCVVAIASGTSVTVTMSDATATTFNVVARNGAGSSTASAESASVTPVQTPSTLSGAVEKNGSNTAGWLVAWSASTRATLYTVTATSGAQTLTYTTTGTSYTIPASALNADATYVITVTPSNSAGNGTAGTAGVTSSTAAATSVIAWDNAASAPTSRTLTWTASAAILPVTYTVTAQLSNATVTLVTGLTAATYTFNPTGYSNVAVTAVSAFGNSTPASAGNTYAALGVPAAPAKSGSATIAATTYSVTITKGSTGTSDVTATYVGTVTSAAGVVTACTLATLTFTCTGLSANTSYTFSVTETDFFGTSTALTDSFVTLDAASATPVITAVTKSGTSVTITWSAGTNTVGSTATATYVVKVSSDGGTTWKYCSTVLTGSSTSCTITGLAAGTYTYSVAAVNEAGSNADTALSSTSSTFLITAAAAPNDPTALTFSYPAFGSLKASWTAPTTGDAVTSYTVTAVGSDGSTGTCTVSGTTATCSLPTNVAYNVSVTATNATGSNTTALTGTSSAYVNAAPARFAVISQVSGTLSIAGNAPAGPVGTVYGAPATSYLVTAKPATGAAVTKTCSAIGTTAALVAGCTVTGLVAGATYSVTVAPVSAAGSATTYQTASAVVTSAVAPAAPTAVSALRTTNGLSVGWTAPASAGSGQLVGYWVSATDALTGQQYTCPYNATYGVLLAPSVSCYIAGLTVGNSYTVSVTAISLDGANTKQLSAPATKVVEYNSLSPEPVMATFLAVTAKQKSVSALSGAAKSALNNLISITNDGAKITVTGYGTTKTIALARANAAASYLTSNGAAVHVSIQTVISKTIKTALVTVTSN
jgi:titin